MGLKEKYSKYFERELVPLLEDIDGIRGKVVSTLPNANQIPEQVRFFKKDSSGKFVEYIKLEGQIHALGGTSTSDGEEVSLSDYVLKTRELSINGTSYDLSANRSWTVNIPIDLTANYAWTGQHTYTKSLDNDYRLLIDNMESTGTNARSSFYTRANQGGVQAGASFQVFASQYNDATLAGFARINLDDGLNGLIVNIPDNKYISYQHNAVEFVKMNAENYSSAHIKAVQGEGIYEGIELSVYPNDFETAELQGFAKMNVDDTLNGLIFNVPDTTYYQFTINDIEFAKLDADYLYLKSLDIAESKFIVDTLGQLIKIDNTLATDSTGNVLGSNGTSYTVLTMKEDDFNYGSNEISIDYVNGQAADATHKGFLTSTDWNTFNNKAGFPAAGIALSTGSAWGTSIVDNSANWNSAYSWGDHALAGYAIAPATNTDNYVPLWNGANSKTLKSGLAYTSGATASTLMYRGIINETSIGILVATSYVSIGGQLTDDANIYMAQYGVPYQARLYVATLTDYRAIALPNKSGTIALTSDIASQNAIYSIAVSGQTTVTAASSTQELTLVAGTNISITTDNTAKSVTINAAAGGGSMVYPGAGIALSTGSAWDTSITDNHVAWDAAAPSSRTLTINGVTYDLTADRSWTVSGSGMAYPSAGIALSTGSAWDTSITDNHVAWDNAVPGTREITINGVTYDLSTDRTWTIGGTMTYPGAGIPISTGSSWDTSITDNHTLWDAGYTYRLLSASGTSPLTLTLSSNALTGSVATFAGSSAGLVPVSFGGTSNYLRADGTWAVPAGGSGMVYPGAGIAVSNGSAWVASLTDNHVNWDAAYTHSVSAHQTIINGTGFVKASGTSLSYDNTTYTPTSRTLTINGVGYDLSANRSWTISGTMIYPGAGIPLSTGSAWGTSITNNSAQWNAAYTHKATEDAINGIIKCNGAGSYSAVTDNSTNWNTAYTYRLTSASGTAPLTLTLSSNALTGSVAQFGTYNAGIVPMSGGGSSAYLRADGYWVTPPFVPTSRTITINGTSYDLSANRSWTVGDVYQTTTYIDTTPVATLYVASSSGSLPTTPINVVNIYINGIRQQMLTKPL